MLISRPYVHDKWGLGGVPGEVEGKSPSWQLLPQYLSDGQTKCWGKNPHRHSFLGVFSFLFFLIFP